MILSNSVGRLFFCAPIDQPHEIVLTLRFTSSLRYLSNKQNFSSELVLQFFTAQKLEIFTSNIFKSQVRLSNKIDFGFKFRTPLSEIICIVCTNICDPDRFGQNFAPWNRVAIANNLSLSIKVRTSLLN